MGNDCDSTVKCRWVGSECHDGVDRDVTVGLVKPHHLIVLAGNDVKWWWRVKIMCDIAERGLIDTGSCGITYTNTL